MPEPIRVEDLPESRQAELVLAAVDAGVWVEKSHYNKHRPFFAAYQKTGEMVQTLDEYTTSAHALAAAALALGLEPRWRVVDKVVADEARVFVQEAANDAREAAEGLEEHRPILPEQEESRQTLIAASKRMTASLSALARALRGEG